MTQQERTSVQFALLAECPIKEGTKLVISLRSDGNVSMAQQIEMRSGNKIMHVFLKNSIEVAPEVLYDILNTIQKAIDALFAHESP